MGCCLLLGLHMGESPRVPSLGPTTVPQGWGSTPGCGSDANTNLLISEEAIFGNQQGLRYLPIARLHCHQGMATLLLLPTLVETRPRWGWQLSTPLGGISAFR